MEDQKQVDIWDELQSAAPADSLDEEMFELLSAYLDGECSAKERRLVEAYLASSPNAAGVLADLRSQAALLAHQFEPPADLSARILSKTGAGRQPAKVWRWAIPVGLAGAVLFAQLLRSGGANSEPAAPSAPTAMRVEPNGAEAKKPAQLHDLEQSPSVSNQAEPPVRVASTQQPEPGTADPRLMNAVMNATMAGSIAGGAQPKSSDVKKVVSPTVTPAAQTKLTPAAGTGSSVPFPAPQRPDVVAIISDEDAPATTAAEPQPQPDANESLRAMLKEHNKNRTDLKDADKIQF